MEEHYFIGVVDFPDTQCELCGRDKNDISHKKNAGQVCDNPHGPCSCGAWHNESTSTKGLKESVLPG